MRYILLIGLLLTLSCKKSKTESEVFPTGTFIDVPMTVIDTGPVPVDGCDWCLRDSVGVYYSPENLDVSYKVDRTTLYVTFTYKGTRFVCGNSVPNKGPAVLHILGVRK